MVVGHRGQLTLPSWVPRTRDQVWGNAYRPHGSVARSVSGVTGGKMRRTKAIAAVVGMLSLASLAPASSQNQPSTSDISDQKLDQVAAAMVRVDSLHKSYQQKLDQT